MERNLEEELILPSPVRTIQKASVKNPLFEEAVNQIKNPREREAFLRIFNNYLLSAYQNNPGMNGLMKTHELSDIVYNSPEEYVEDETSERIYSEPGRMYPYVNNFLGKRKDKKSLLKKLYYTAKDFTRETLPGIVGMGALGGVKYWHKGMMKARAFENAKNMLVPSHKVWTPSLWGTISNPSWYINKATQAGKSAIKGLVKDTFVDAVGWALNPAKYLLAGYFLYKTIKYFVKKYKERKENKELEKLNKNVWMQNQLLAQRV